MSQERAQQALPAGALCLPALPPTVDRAGTPVGELSLLLHRTRDGRLVADVYSSPARLAAARGQDQTWVAMHEADLAALLDRADVDQVVLDLGSPDAQLIGADGTVSPLEGPDA